MTFLLRSAVIFLFVVNVQCAENLALYKPANQTGGWHGLTPDKAVDGRYGSPDGGQDYCAHPDNRRSGQPAEWWVDLQDTYLVDNVTIYNTFYLFGSQRMTQFVVSVGSTIDTRTDCGRPYMDTVPRGGYVTITCNIRGRFVHFKRIGGFQPSLVALCEVKVYGRKDIDCSRCPVNVPCNGITGCSQCEAGKLPPDCVRACPDMTYGINCSSQCGRCRNNNACNKSSGYCPSNDGCELWFVGQKCDVEVVVPQRTDEDIKLGQITKDKIEVTWQQIKNLPSVTEGYYKYRVNYRRVGDSDYQAQLIVLHHSSTWNSATIGNLTYNTKYEIRVTPFREMGDLQDLGSAYNTVTGRTKCGVPESPTLLSVKAESSKTSREIVKLKYESVLNLDSRCNNLEKVWVEYRLNGTQTWLRNDCDLHNTTCTLLPPNGGIYAIRLTVKNDGGVSGSSNVEYVSVQGPEPSHKMRDLISYLPWLAVGVSVLIIFILAILLWKARRSLARQKKTSLSASVLHPVVAENESRLHARDNIDAISYEDAQDRDNPLSNDKKQYEGISSVTGGVYQNSMVTGPYEELKTLNREC